MKETSNLNFNPRAANIRWKPPSAPTGHQVEVFADGHIPLTGILNLT